MSKFTRKEMNKNDKSHKVLYVRTSLVRKKYEEIKFQISRNIKFSRFCFQIASLGLGFHSVLSAYLQLQNS